MPKYNVTVFYTATAIVEVEAENPQDAAEEAYCDAPISVCHQCAGKFDIGDAYKVIVSDSDWNELYDDSEDSDKG